MRTSTLLSHTLKPIDPNPEPNALSSDTFDAAAIPLPPVHGCHIEPQMTFEAASEVFLEWLTGPISQGRSCYVSLNTMKDLSRKAKALNKFFRALKLCDVHIGHIREYQRMRSANERGLWAHPAGAGKVNQELGLLQRILKLGDCYQASMEKYYMPLKTEDREIPKALSPEEQDHYLEIVASRPEWKTLYWYSLVALHVAFSSSEMRSLRQGDLNLNFGILAVNRHAAKNKYRRREVPLTDSSCLWALEKILERSIELVGKSPENYLFPFRIGPGRYTTELHVSENGMRRKHEEVRAIAGLDWFQINGWRHTAITRMAEAGVPIAIIMARAGHISQRMSMHYTHISQQAERLAMQKVSGGRRQPIPSETAKLRSAHIPADVQTVSKLHSVAKVEQPSPSPQTLSVAATPRQQTASPESSTFEGGFYISATTW